MKSGVPERVSIFKQYYVDIKSSILVIQKYKCNYGSVKCNHVSVKCNYGSVKCNYGSVKCNHGIFLNTKRFLCHYVMPWELLNQLTKSSMKFNCTPLRLVSVNPPQSIIIYHSWNNAWCCALPLKLSSRSIPMIMTIYTPSLLHKACKRCYKMQSGMKTLHKSKYKNKNTECCSV